MNQTRLAGLILLFALGEACAAPLPADSEEFFETRIRPVLIRSCTKCHGGGKAAQGLRLDSRQGLLLGGDSGPALVPGNPAASLLIRAIRHDSQDLRMPPKQKLPPAVIADFEAWVERGAVWPSTTEAPAADEAAWHSHWAFQPLQKIVPPRNPMGCSEHPIDCFVMADLQRNGLLPNCIAPPRPLVRRLVFDLTGLPPTPQQADEFSRDPSEQAWLKLIDCLLASPRYGERWGRHWLDVVHYADTAGDNADYPVPEASLYRDYVIDAFNQDKPYDQFVREQIAGDILAHKMVQQTTADDGPPAQLGRRYAEQIIATGFLALSRRYGTMPYERWHLVLEDTIETTCRSLLGLTMRCARCHDHKFDPLTQEDYYALYGIFASTQFPYAGSEEFGGELHDRQNFVPLLLPHEAQERIAANTKTIEALQTELERVLQANGPQSARDRLETEIKKRRRFGLPPNLPGAYAVVEGPAHDTAVQSGGDPNGPGAVISRGVPQAIAGDQPFQIPPGASGRRQLAEWIVNPNHPLTGRVIVNRVWQYHFGSGLVQTPSNFGLRGGAPSHPQLLDWLTSWFIENGWSLKRLHRLILTSTTYRLSSDWNEQAAEIDPDNRLNWRFDRRRLDAESIRDALLTVCGELDLSRPGRHPFPELSEWTWTQHRPFKAVYPTRTRSVYLMTQRQFRHPFLALFDGPDTNHSTPKRSASSTPQQSLYLLNDPFVRQRARGFASRLLAASPKPADRIRLAYALALNRPATANEVAAGLAYLANYAQQLAAIPIPPDEVQPEAWNSYAWVLLTSNEFLYVD